MTDDEVIRPTPYQARLLEVPADVDVFLGGGRGGGKSHGIAFLILRHVEQFPGARVLYVRRTHRAVEDFATTLGGLFVAAYSGAARHNAAEGFWKLPNCGYVEVGPLADESMYSRYQGRSFSLVIVDELTQFADPWLVDRLRSNLRGPRGVPLRLVLAGNPGDVGHAWVAARYVLGREPWQTFDETESRRSFVYAPSTHLDNPHLDAAEYRAQLEAAAAGDPELLRAWLGGSWNVARGAMFGPVIDDDHVALDAAAWSPDAFARIRSGHEVNERGNRLIRFGVNAPRARRRPDAWRVFLAHDYGSAAPSATYVVARSPGAVGPDERHFPAGSLLLLDELATCADGNPSKGLGQTIPELGEWICDLADRWGTEPRGVADDSIFARIGHSAGSIASELRRALRTRAEGWPRRGLVHDAANARRRGRTGSPRTLRLATVSRLVANGPVAPARRSESRGPRHARARPLRRRHPLCGGSGRGRRRRDGEGSWLVLGAIVTGNSAQLWRPWSKWHV